MDTHVCAAVYLVCVLIQCGIQSFGLFKAIYPPPPGRPVHSNAISTSLRIIQPRCNYCANLLVQISISDYFQVLIYAAEWTVAKWDERNCQSFETAARVFETGFSRLRVQHSDREATAPHLLLLCRHAQTSIVVMRSLGSSLFRLTSDILALDVGFLAGVSNVI